MGVKVVYNVYLKYFTKRSVQDNWRRLDHLHMGHSRGVVNLRNGWHWLRKIHMGRGI